MTDNWRFFSTIVHNATMEDNLLIKNRDCTILGSLPYYWKLKNDLINAVFEKPR